jgi:hypothetical protein
MCCNASCIDRMADPQNCGQCGVQCVTGDICTSGSCALPDAGYQSCNGKPGACPPGTVCNGSSCLSVTCAPGGSGEACAFGAGYGANGYTLTPGKCCGGACTDPNQDPANCGSCGTTCTMGADLCVAGMLGIGMAVCLPPLTTNCPFPCTNGTFCAGGFCQPSACMGLSGGVCQTGGGAVGTCCPFGFGGSQCTDVASDPNNCGGCDVSCGSGGTCTNGVCSTTPASCPKGHSGQYCKLDAGLSFACCPGAGCVDTSSDSNNCGRCDSPCGSGLSCVSGGCVALSCTASVQGYSCEDDAGTVGTCCGAACVHRGSDPKNCGGCGNICVGAETCVSGDCGLNTCDSTTIGSACHFDAGTYITGGECCVAGCVDTLADVNNCGGCNRQCPMGTRCLDGNCQ